jgi:ABC-type phosphate transport system substrate-binding protein
MNANLIYVTTTVLVDILLVPHGTSIFAQVQPPSQLSQQQGQITLNGAGATFPFPLIDTWRVEYQNVIRVLLLPLAIPGPEHQY